VGFIDAIHRERSEGILLLCGGLTIHNLRDRSCFDETKAADIYKQFDNAVTQAVQVRDVSDPH
jgi:aromatic ring-opening dioxygenase catalytic subunit (LigB family)